MSGFIDSNVFFAYTDIRDEHHDRGIELLSDALRNKTYGTLYISDYIVDECVTLTYAHTKDKAKAIELGRYLLSSEFQMIHTTSDLFETGWRLFQKTNRLSFTDCTIAASMHHLNIEHLLSFDKAFDAIGIHRIE